MTYAFRIFAAIYGYKVVDNSSNSARFRCVYGQPSIVSDGQGTLLIPARYRVRPPNAHVGPLTQYRYANENFYLAFGVDEATGNPDWLGEIFEWLSSAYETGIFKRDSLGRIPYSETVFAKQGINPRRPHTNLLMAWMENALRAIGIQALPRPPSPLSSVEHMILCCHDIDFYYTSRRPALVRVLKNLGISLLVYRSPSFLADNTRYLVRLLSGRSVGNYLQPLMGRLEELGFRSTFFAVARCGHRRDPAYDVKEIASDLVEASRRGFSVAVHGSYRSIVEDRSLAGEVRALSQIVGGPVLGGRQHWLRFDLHQKLFDQIEEAGLISDSTLGFPDKVGFRNGASFAFPPYDFHKEAPCKFLEFPLALMDGSIEATCRVTGENPQNVANEILDESMRWGWGGIAVLWHNPLEPLQVPQEINRVFWNCAKRQSVSREKWMSTDQFLDCCLHRYQTAGLLERVTLSAIPLPPFHTSASCADNLVSLHTHS